MSLFLALNNSLGKQKGGFHEGGVKMRTIKVIHHNVVAQKKDTTETYTQKTRVAAYCRVSTLEEEQELSYETQYDYYTARFQKDDTKILVGVYGDNGISGVQASKRPGFMEMIQHCRLGRIQEVYTKSISRFARNFAECIQYTRELKELGVIVHFEKEGITTLDENIEMVLTLMSIVAQEESNSISQSVSWAMEKRSEAGDPIRRAVYGYTRDSFPTNGVHQWHINLEEAKRVRMVFRFFLEGNSYNQIIKHMTAYESKMGVTRKWSAVGIRNMLKHEAYVGDLLTAKSYTVDYLTKTRKVNKGEKEQQYIKDHHPAIISREDFNRVQQIFEERRSA